MTPASAILACAEWPTNAELIADCAHLGYLREEWYTLDCTYGLGTFWSLWRPEKLMATDISPALSRGHVSIDFRDMPFDDHHFDCVVFDPPYKLNGTPTDEIDERYGVHVVQTWRERLTLILAGVRECARVLGDGFLLVKCKDQVVSGKVRWQADLVTEEAAKMGLGKVDRFDLLNYRPQPSGRRQVHARRNSSQLLVFKRGWSSA